MNHCSSFGSDKLPFPNEDFSHASCSKKRQENALSLKHYVDDKLLFHFILF